MPTADRRALLRQFAAFAAENASCWAVNADGVSVRASVTICLIALHCTKFRRQWLISEQPYLALAKISCDFSQLWSGTVIAEIASRKDCAVPRMTTEAGTSLKPSGETTSGDFEPEQKRYLEGFVAGLQIAKTAKGIAAPAADVSPASKEAIGPDAAARKAQDRVLAAGGKLSDPEKFKRDEHPFDAYERLKAHAAKNEYPKPPDNFRWRYFGLFYVAPNQNSYMCRLRMPNGILKAAQLAGVADLAERYGGGYAHVTTRANLQIREIEAKNAVAMIEAMQDLGLCSRGSGADNIRNVTGTPTAGIDPQELIDTRPYAREWHFHILNDRSLYGLPRKFNVGFDGAGIIPVLEDTNDIGFQAVQVNDGFGARAGRLVSALSRRPHRPPKLRRRHRRHRQAGARRHWWPTRWCASSSITATAPTAPRRGSNTCSTRWVSRNSSRSWRKSSAASSTAPCLARWRRGRRSRAPPISASMRRSRTGCTGSASWCRSAISALRRCAGSPTSRASSATATSA